MASEQQYLQLYDEQRALLEAGSPAVLNGRRAAAAAGLRAHGLPSMRVERYKYTDVEAAFAPDYGVNLHRHAPAESPYQAHPCPVPGLNTALFYVQNDVPADGTAAAQMLPEGAYVLPFREAAERFPALFETYYDRAATRDYDGVAALNTLLAQDGWLVYLQEGVQLSHVLQIVHYSAASADMLSTRRLLVVLEAGARAEMLLCDHADAARRYLSNQVVEVYLAADARLVLNGMEETRYGNVRFNSVFIEQQSGSRVVLNDIVLHNGLTRTRVEARLLGPQATVEMNGAAITDRDERVDNHLLVVHAAESCESRMLYKYVLADRSVGAFAGKILVQEGAQQTQSEQTNANLLTSPDARAYSQPMLEIYADDVKCNHGSTVGKLDDQALFYMRQRGISEAEARLLLQHAFVNDVLEHIEVEALRARVSHLVERRFRGDTASCEGCTMCAPR